MLLVRFPMIRTESARRFLLLDDAWHYSQSMKLTIESRVPGSTVTLVSTLEEARCEVLSEAYHFALVDEALEHGSGFDFAEIVDGLCSEGRLARIPMLIAVSGMEENRQLAQDRGFYGFWLKDSLKDTLTEKLEHLIAGLDMEEASEV